MPRKLGIIRNPDGRTPIHGVSKVSTGISLTPETKEGADAIAKKFGVSRSELVEYLLRSAIANPEMIADALRRGV